MSACVPPQGDPYAIFNLGYMYVRGFPPVAPQNHTEAKKLFEKAAAKGFAPAWNGARRGQEGERACLPACAARLMGPENRAAPRQSRPVPTGAVEVAHTRARGGKWG